MKQKLGHRTKDILGSVQSGRAGLGNIVHRQFSTQEPKDRREMVIEEVHAIDKERRSATAAGFARQCAWSSWEETEERKLSWPNLVHAEPLRISFSSDRRMTSFLHQQTSNKGAVATTIPAVPVTKQVPP